MRDFQTNGVSTTVSGWKKIKLDYIYNILKINFRCIKDVLSARNNTTEYKKTKNNSGVEDTF